MKNKFLPWLLSLVLLSSLACGVFSSIPSMMDFPPTPSMNNVPTGSSPMSGDWHADTEFGYLSFSVDPDGKMVTTAIFHVANWTCGGTTLTTEVQSLSKWNITGGQFTGFTNLNGTFVNITIAGAYDPSSQKFSGTWEESAHNSDCSGTWATIPRK